MAVLQPCYIPWRGYFDIIGSVDLFVVYDDVQYSRGTFQNRNRVKTADGLKWLTVPVASKLGMAIDEVPIAWRGNGDWLRRHTRLLETALSPAPFADDALALWREGVEGAGELLSPLNVRLLEVVCEYLQIRTPFLQSRSFGLSGRSTARLISLLVEVGATCYLSGPSAKSYLDEELFRRAGVGLEYKTYDYEEYPQIWGAFAGNVSILDTIANLGPEARSHIWSRTRDEKAIECG